MSNDSEIETPNFRSENREILEKDPLIGIPQKLENTEIEKDIPQNEVPESKDKNINQTKQSVDNLQSDINNSQVLGNILSGNNLGPINSEKISVSPTIDKTAETLKNINAIKDELCKLPLDTCENDYITNNIFPLLNILYQLSTTSLNLATSFNFLTNSSIVHPKKSEIKDTINLVYNINDECEDVYDAVKRRINLVLKRQGLK